MTPEFYDREYNPRIGVDEPGAIFQRWLARADAARQQLEGRFDLAYGASAGERLDLFPAAAGAADAPLLVFIHGGFWRAFAKENFHWVAPAFVERGIGVALIGYDLAPKVGLTTIVEQARAALAWLYLNAERLGCANRRIVVAGHSAGGHLAAMLACTPWPEAHPRLPADLLHGAIAISPVADLAPIQKTPYLQGDLRISDDEVQRISPARLLPVQSVRIVTAVGGDESSEFQRQNAFLRERWAANLDADVALPGCNHYSACEAFAEPGSPLFDAALRLCGKEAAASPAPAAPPTSSSIS